MLHEDINNDPDGIYEDMQDQYRRDMNEMAEQMEAYYKEEAIKEARLQELSLQITGIDYHMLDEVLDQCQLQQAYDEIDRAYARS